MIWNACDPVRQACTDNGRPCHDRGRRRRVDEYRRGPGRRGAATNSNAAQPTRNRLSSPAKITTSQI